MACCGLLYHAALPDGHILFEVGSGQDVALALLCSEAHSLVSVAHFAGLAGAGEDFHFVEFAYLPSYVYGEVAACFQAADAAFCPGIGQSGQEVDAAGVALHEHLRNTGCAAEVTIDLEGWVDIPKVVGGAVLEQVAEEFIRAIAIVQASPLVEFPAHAPSCSAVAAVVEHYARCLGKAGGGEGRKSRSGV